MFSDHRAAYRQRIPLLQSLYTQLKNEHIGRLLSIVSSGVQRSSGLEAYVEVQHFWLTVVRLDAGRITRSRNR